MFTIRVNADGVKFGPLNVICTGHIRNGMTLYRIKDSKLNHLEIWHKRDQSWEHLVRATMDTLILEKERTE